MAEGPRETLKPMARSSSPDAKNEKRYPWEHVEVDVEGPFPPAGEEHAKYILTHRCKAINASLSCPFKRLTRPRRNTLNARFGFFIEIKSRLEPKRLENIY